MQPDTSIAQKEQSVENKKTECGCEFFLFVLFYFCGKKEKNIIIKLIKRKITMTAISNSGYLIKKAALLRQPNARKLRVY